MRSWYYFVCCIKPPWIGKMTPIVWPIFKWWKGERMRVLIGLMWWSDHLPLLRAFFTMLKHQTGLFITTKLASSHLAAACEIKSQFYISDWTQFYPRLRDFRKLSPLLGQNKVMSCIHRYKSYHNRKQNIFGLLDHTKRREDADTDRSLWDIREW